MAMGLPPPIFGRDKMLHESLFSESSLSKRKTNSFFFFLSSASSPEWGKSCTFFWGGGEEKWAEGESSKEH